MAVERKLDLKCDNCGDETTINEEALGTTEWGIVTVETFDRNTYIEKVMCPQCIGNTFLMDEGTDED